MLIEATAVGLMVMGVLARRKRLRESDNEGVPQMTEVIVIIYFRSEDGNVVNGK